MIATGDHVGRGIRHVGQKLFERRAFWGGYTGAIFIFVVCAFLALSGPVRAGEAQHNVVEELGTQSPFLILQTNLQPPYQQLRDGLLGGDSINILNCAFKEIGVQYGLALAPRQRNREMTRNGQADGFFLARLSNTMSTYADPSLPLALEKWVWVSVRHGDGSKPERTLPTPQSGLTVGAILGSNEAEWLAEQGFGDIVRPPSIKTLIELLRAGRVDYVLIDKRFFQRARAQMNLTTDGFSLRFERYTPLVIYFARRFTTHHPGLLKRLNVALTHCGTQVLALEQWEKREIERSEVTWIRQLAKSKDLIAELKKAIARNPKDDNEIKRLDNSWKTEEAEGRTSAMAAQLLDNPVSQRLRTFQADHGRRVAEIFAFDRRGLILGMSRLTSNFDQSGEEKFKIFDAPSAHPVQIADIYFDASTHRFLTQVTLPVADPESGKIIAAITVGLDVSEVLHPES